MGQDRLSIPLENEVMWKVKTLLPSGPQPYQLYEAKFTNSPISNKPRILQLVGEAIGNRWHRDSSCHLLCRSMTPFHLLIMGVIYRRQRVRDLTVRIIPRFPICSLCIIFYIRQPGRPYNMFEPLHIGGVVQPVLRDRSYTAPSPQPGQVVLLVSLQLPVRMQRIDIYAGNACRGAVIHEEIESARYECSICYDMISRQSKMWYCNACYDVFHHGCIVLSK